MERHNISNGILYIGDVLEGLKALESESIDIIITSPPYWSLRDYGPEGQIGLEYDFKDYLERLFLVFKESKRVLKDNGSLWLNIGDTYAGSGKGAGTNPNNSKELFTFKKRPPIHDTLTRKSLYMIPERLALMLLNDGWVLRNKIIWHKINIKPENVKDRFTNDFEPIYFFTKKPKYYFKQQFEPYKTPLNRYAKRFKPSDKAEWDRATGQNLYRDRAPRPNPKGRNMRAVWSMITGQYKGAHTAVFPLDLPKRCIDAGCPPGGVVLDPFIGSGTTAEAAEYKGCRWIGIDINPDNIPLIKERLKQRSLSAWVAER